MQVCSQPVSPVVDMAPKQTNAKCVAPASGASGADRVSEPQTKKQKTLSLTASKEQNKEDAQPSKSGKPLSKNAKSTAAGAKAKAKAKAKSKAKASSTGADKGKAKSKAWIGEREVEFFDYCSFLSILSIQSLWLYH